MMALRCGMCGTMVIEGRKCSGCKPYSLDVLYNNTPLWQMGPYERASLLYAIHTIKNCYPFANLTAIEVGSYFGGFTKELLKTFNTVFSLDIDHSKLQQECIDDARLKRILGDSKVTLPKILKQTDPDFILIDGDHSYNGVKGDLQAIVDSLREESRPFIFVHDAAYPESRKALEEFKKSNSEYEVDVNFAPGVPFGETCVGGLAFICKKEKKGSK